ncbi:MAG TPA: glycosyltransferase [Vicinamibacteria bacterium]
MFSLVIPVFRNEGSIPRLLETLEALNRSMGGDLEVVFVVDGSPDRSLEALSRALPGRSFAGQLLVLSRNFGSFAAIAAGLAHAQGPLYAVMAADLQEPPELMLEFRKRLQAGDCEVVIGTRARRSDPLLSRLVSALFWRAYRLFVQREVPPGGVDVFGCTELFRDQLLALRERNTTLVGLVFWLGFARAEVPYARQPRQEGRSGWSLARRLRYLLDSTFAFSDLPIRLLSLAGLVGLLLAGLLGVLVAWARLRGDIQVPGYAATVLVVMFFGALNSLGIGILGEYLWRTFENTKGRPGYVVARHRRFGAAAGA